VFSRANLRRLLATGLVLGVLAAVTPAAGLASNPGGGGHLVGSSRWGEVLPSTRSSRRRAEPVATDRPPRDWKRGGGWLVPESRAL